VIRRYSIPWPSRQLAVEREGRPVRLLAVSDEPVRALDFERNRTQLAPIDAVLGCGDLEPDYLSFLADAFHVPLLFVLGNHDRGANWRALSEALPEPLNGKSEQIGGVTVAGMSWPGDMRSRAVRDDVGAWGQAIGFTLHRPRGRPLIMISHVPPLGLNDTPEDAFHRGFAAYHWLCRRLNPALWLHGHTSLAASPGWRVQWGDTTLLNVTGAVLVEIGEPADEGATIAAEEARPGGAARRPEHVSAERP
jgi:uncharacterized protein